MTPHYHTVFLWEWVTPPPCGKIPTLSRFLWLFFSQNEHSGTQSKINLKWSNWSDNTSPYCKTCFSTSELIWHAKNHLVKLQKKWDLGRPAPLFFSSSKFPHFPVFFCRRPLYYCVCQQKESFWRGTVRRGTLKRMNFKIYMLCLCFPFKTVRFLDKASLCRWFATLCWFASLCRWFAIHWLYITLH